MAMVIGDGLELLNLHQPHCMGEVMRGRRGSSHTSEGPLALVCLLVSLSPCLLGLGH